MPQICHAYRRGGTVALLRFLIVNGAAKYAAGMGYTTIFATA